MPERWSLHGSAGFIGMYFCTVGYWLPLLEHSNAALSPDVSNDQLADLEHSDGH